MRLTVLSAFAILAFTSPALAHHPRDRDRDGDRHRGHEEGNGFHRYYGSEYGVTDQALRPEPRSGGDRHDDGRERRRDGGHERRAPIT